MYDHSVIDSMLQDLVPGVHPLRFTDLPLSHQVKVEEILEMIALASNARASSAIIFNTVDRLEHSTLAQLQQHDKVPFFLLGPLHKMAPTLSTSLLKEDTDCIEWLNKQAPHSVVYISMGSLATMDNKELTAIAWGLADSHQPFLWVVRPGSVHDSEWAELLLKDFKEEIGERGLIVKWAPQKEVLAHGAVGSFWSHCGWNSTLESLSEGVPMVCRPCFGDQKVNARYLCHVWRVGVLLEGELERGKIKKAITRLMRHDEGKEIRQRSIDMKEIIKKSIEKGGSSYNYANDLAELILSFSAQK